MLPSFETVKRSEKKLPSFKRPVNSWQEVALNEQFANAFNVPAYKPLYKDSFLYRFLNTQANRYGPSVERMGLYNAREKPTSTTNPYYSKFTKDNWNNLPAWMLTSQVVQYPMVYKNYPVDRRLYTVVPGVNYVGNRAPNIWQQEMTRLQFQQAILNSPSAYQRAGGLTTVAPLYPAGMANYTPPVAPAGGSYGGQYPYPYPTYGGSPSDYVPNWYMNLVNWKI